MGDTTQQGGMVGYFQTLMNNLDSPAKLIYGFIIIILIVYSSLIPSEYRFFADSILGRVFGIAIIYGVIQSMGWVYGLLTALAFLLVLNGASRSEGFNGGGTIDEKKSINKKEWLVEQILNENTKKTEISKVSTSAIHS